MSSLVLVIFVQILLFLVVTSVLITGQGLRSYSLCRGVSWTCLIGYSFTKFMIFVFLIERVHIVRAPFCKRRKDKIYLGCLAMLFVAFLPLCIKYYNPLTKIDPVTGRCRAGNRREAIIPTIAVMSAVDVILTGVFFYLLRPVGQIHAKPSVKQILTGKRDNSKTPGETSVQETSAQRNIRILLWKSIVGSVLIELPAIANFIQMAITRGEELGMICLSICVAEGQSSSSFSFLRSKLMYPVVWDAMVIYWLTFGSSAKAEKELNQTSYVSMPSTSAGTRKDSVEIGKLGDVIALEENTTKRSDSE